MAAAAVPAKAALHRRFPHGWPLGALPRGLRATPELGPQRIRLCREEQSLQRPWEAVSNDRGLYAIIALPCPFCKCHDSSCPIFRYMVAADELQANFTGRQQRKGVFILPHAVPKVFALGRLKPRTVSGHASEDDDEEAPRAPRSGRGRQSGVRSQSGKRGSRRQAPRTSAPVATDGPAADAQAITFDAGSDSDDELPKGFMFAWGEYKKVWGETPYEDAVTALFAEYAVLYGRIAGWTMAGAPASMNLQEAKSLQDHAGEFIDKYVRPILGEVHTPKVHKLLRHLLDAIKMHGNLNNGSTSSNEAGHKVDKRFYRRTNRVANTFTAQIARQSQGTQAVLARIAKLDADAISMDQIRRARRSAARGGQLTAQSMRSLRGVPRMTVGALSLRPGLARLRAVLDLHPNTRLHVLGRVIFMAKLEDGTPMRQTLRAYSSYRRKGPWFDVVVYTVEGDAPTVDDDGVKPRWRYGEVRALLRYDEEDVAVVCDLEEVEADDFCPSGERQCKRFKWAVPDPSDGDWQLRVVPTSRVCRVTHVVPDFAELSDRLGMKALPARYSAPVSEQRAMRFYENAFFAWE